MDYRLYVFAQVGRIATVEELNCADDDLAVAEAEAIRQGRPAELWQQGRVVKAWDRGGSEPPARGDIPDTAG